MEHHADRLKESLRASGRPMTGQRMQVWEALLAQANHPTAADLHARCPDLPLATVYNTLELFTELGLVRPVMLEGSVRYDVNTSEHVHVICTRCGEVTDVTISMPPAMQEWVGMESGYRLAYSRVDWFGVCPACQE